MIGGENTSSFTTILLLPCLAKVSCGVKYFHALYGIYVTKLMCSVCINAKGNIFSTFYNDVVMQTI